MMNNRPTRRKKLARPEPVYSANVFRYTCVGQLELSSDKNGSQGSCRGIQFPTELVGSFVPGTREQCIKNFLRTSSEDDLSDENFGGDQKVKQIYSSRTLIYKDTGDHDDTTDDANNNAKNKNKKGKNWNKRKRQNSGMIVKKKTLLEEDLIDKTKWYCNGSTTVDYLVLTPTASWTPAAAAYLHNPAAARGVNPEINPYAASDLQKKKNNGKVVAVTPDMGTFGISYREIDSKMGHFTMIDIGLFRICLETPAGMLDYKDKGEDTQRMEKESEKRLEEKKIFDIEESAGKAYGFSLKVLAKMKENTELLRDAVSDDITGRTVTFGHKIIGQFGRTFSLTWQGMGKLTDIAWKASGFGGDDDGKGGGGGRGWN